MAKRNARLDAIKAKLQKTNLGGGSEFWKPKQGDNLIRLLPGVGEMNDIFWVEKGSHFIELGSNNWKTWICPEFTAGEPCPICEYVRALYNTGDKGDKTLADDLRMTKAYSVNLIDRKNEDKGVQIYNGKVTVMRQWAALIGDPEYGDLIVDVDDGLDMTITRAGAGRQTTYTVTARRNESPLSDDSDQIDKWLDAAIDLTPVELSDDPEEDAEMYKDEGVQVAVFGIAPYERIKREFEGIGEGEEDEVEEDEPEEEEEYAEARQAISRRRGSRTAAPTTSSRAPRRRAR